jgi:hypothetical protein
MDETQKFNTGMKFDKDKPQMELLPFNTLVEIAKVLSVGANKYGKYNWKMMEDTSRYEAALLRHYAAYQSGEMYDRETGLSHLAHLGCNALFLLYFFLEEEKKQNAKQLFSE